MEAEWMNRFGDFNGPTLGLSHCVKHLALDFGHPLSRLDFLPIRL
jgi:hypothetical protein